MNSVVTEEGHAVWPKLNRPDQYNEQSRPEYNVKLALSGDAAEKLIKSIDKALDDAPAELATWKKKNFKPQHLKKKAPLPYDNEVDEDGQETGRMLFKFKTPASIKNWKTGEEVPNKPELFDAKLNPITDEIWGGSKIKISAQLRPYCVPAIGLGIQLRIRGVQVIELVGPKSSGGSEGFSSEEGYETSASPDTRVPVELDDGLTRTFDGEDDGF
jgi:hypothetical protein